MNSSSNIHDYSRVITYVNIRLSSFWFSFCKDVLNYRDILLISFFINNNIFFLINIYLDSLCYDLRLGLGCNLGKNLRKNEKCVQLVKHKEYKAVSTLYIRISYEESIHSTQGNQVIVHKAKARMLYLLHKALTEIPVAQLIMSSLPFAQVHAVFRRYRS